MEWYDMTLNNKHVMKIQTQNVSNPYLASPKSCVNGVHCCDQILLSFPTAIRFGCQKWRVRHFGWRNSNPSGSWYINTLSRCSSIHIWTLIGSEGSFIHSSSACLRQMFLISYGIRKVLRVIVSLASAKSLTSLVCCYIICTYDSLKTCIWAILCFMFSEMPVPNAYRNPLTIDRWQCSPRQLRCIVFS